MNTLDVEHNTARAAGLLKAIANENRLMILCALFNGKKNVTELEEIIGLSQSAISQHLAILRSENIVSAQRKARAVYYSLDNAEATQILKTLQSLYDQKQPDDDLPDEFVKQTIKDIRDEFTCHKDLENKGYLKKMPGD